MKDKNIITIPNDPMMNGLARIVPDVVFAVPEGKELKMQLVIPWGFEGDTRKYPLIVFLQGSGWTFPDVNYELPQLCRYAQNGYVAASITHRNSLEGHPFPAYLEDTKSAIRFLKANADKFQIDTDRICFWGTSSGGNTALLVAVTGDCKEYDKGDNLEFDSKVKCVVECFGPSDLTAMIPAKYLPDMDKPGNLFYELCGGSIAEHKDIIHRMSPIKYVKPGMDIPPVLLIQGNADPVVPYSQSESMYDKLLESGYDAEMICVDGAPHEGSFWSIELHKMIAEFIKTHI